MVPVHPDDQQLHGTSWQGTIYTDTALPFGPCSAPADMFSVLADMLAWAMVCNGMKFAIRYLDDFLIFGPPNCNIVANSRESALRTCMQLQFPMATEKTADPATSLVFLEICINTMNGTCMLSLPQEKLSHLHIMLHQWQNWKIAPSKSELLSVLGVLSHAASVIHPGRAFVKNLINQRWQQVSLHDHVIKMFGCYESSAYYM